MLYRFIWSLCTHFKLHCLLHVCNSAILHVQSFSVVQQKTVVPSTTPTTSNPTTSSPVDDQNGPRAEKLISPTSLRNWLKRIKVLFIVVLDQFNYLICRLCVVYVAPLD